MIAGSGMVTLAKGMSLAFVAARLQRDFGLGPATIGALIGFGPLLGAVVAPLAGSISDRIGRKNVLVVALFSASVSLAGLGLAQSIMVFVAAHILSAVAGAVYEPVSRALMSDTSPEKLRLRVFSWRYLAINLGRAVGPMIGVYIGASFAALFMIASLVHALFAVAIACAVPSLSNKGESHEATSRRINWRDLASALRDGRLLFFVGGSTLLLAVHGQWSITLSQYLGTSFEDGVRLFALLVTTNAVTVVVASTPARFLIERIGARNSVALGCILFLAGEVGFAASSAFEGLLISMVMFTLGEVLAVPAEYMLVDGIANDRNRGTYFGAHSLATVGNFLGPLLGGVALSAAGGAGMFFLFAVLAAASAVLFIIGHALPPPVVPNRPVHREDSRGSPEDSYRFVPAGFAAKLQQYAWSAFMITDVLKGVRASIFDVFGTVVDWRSGVAQEAGSFLARHRFGTVDPAEFADAWRRHYFAAMEEARSGRRSFTRLDVLHRDNLEKVLADFGLDPQHVPSTHLDELNLAWHRLDSWRDSIAGLERLKAKYVIAPLSYGNIILLLDMAKHAGLSWDAILGAEVVRAY